MDESWDDSYDYDAPAKPAVAKSSLPSAGSRLTQLDAKIPLSTTPARKIKKTSSDDDIDALFSPAHSVSDSGTPAGKKSGSVFAFDDSIATPAKDAVDYLANVTANSQDLEDSILGELLGGPKRALKPPSNNHSASTKSSRAQRLEPLDADKNTSLRNAPDLSKGRATTSPSSAKGSNKTKFDFDKSGDFDTSTDYLFDDDPHKPPLAAHPPLQPASRGLADLSSVGGILHTKSDLPDPFKKPQQSKHMRYNSFDDTHADTLNALDRDAHALNTSGSVASSYDYSSRNNHSRGAAEPLRSSLTSGGVADTSRDDGYNFPPPLSSGKAKVTYADEAPVAPVAAAAAAKKAATGPGSKNVDEDEVDMGGFTPSLMDAGRRGRRRNLGHSPDKSDGGASTYGSMMGGGGGDFSAPGTAASVRSSSQLDELDMALGLSKLNAAAGGGGGGGNTVAAAKKPVDPFSAAEAKAATTRASMDYGNVNYDSSSDEDNYRLKRHAKATFGLFNKATSVHNTSSASISIPTPTPAAVGGSSAHAGTTTPVTPATGSTTASQPQPPQATKKVEPLSVQTVSSVGGVVPVAPQSPRLPNSAAASAAPHHHTLVTPAALSIPPVDQPTSRDGRPGLSRSPGSHNNSGGNLKEHLPSTTAPVANPTTHHPQLLSSLPSLTVSTSNAAAHLSAPLDDVEEDELDVSGIVRSDVGLPASSRSPHSKSRPSSSKSNSGTPRRYSDGGSNSLNNSTNLDDSTSSVSPHHSRGSAKKSQSLKLSDPLESSYGKATTPRPVLQRAHTASETSTGVSNSVELNTQLNSTTSGGLVVDRDAKDKLKQVQRLLESTQSEKEAAERSMRSEIEALKHKLSTSAVVAAPAPSTTPSIPTASYKHFAHEEAEARASVRVFHDEIAEHKRTVSQLEFEVSRLKDEANIKALKHHEELRHLRDRYETEISDIKLRSGIDSESSERRHADSIAALKKIHEDEIAMYKEKSRSNETFSQIAASMKNTTGSIKYIEEQLYAKYRQVELQREGQIEAREKLLSEMEDKARERVELAEAEGYKLKGILAHMESVVSNLRSQGSEEKERLRQEHARLQAMQQAVEHEKSALQNRNTEELHYIKQRSKEVEIELLKLATEKQSHYEYVSSTQHKLDVERAEFNTAVQTAKRAQIAAEQDLRDDETKLHRQREELQSDRAAFEARKTTAMKDIQAVEDLKRSLAAMRDKIDMDNESLKAMARQFAAATEQLDSREADLREHEASLEAREAALVEGYQHMKTAASQLALREQGVRDSMEVMDAKKIELDKIDREVLDRKIALTASQREQLRTSGYAQDYWGDNSRRRGGGGGEGLVPSYLRLTAADAPPAPPAAAAPAAPWMDTFRQQMKHSYAAGLTSGAAAAQRSSAAWFPPNPAGGAQHSPLPKELRMAQQTLQQSRSALGRVSSNHLNIQRSLADENAFLAGLKKPETGRGAGSAGQ